MSPSVGVRSDRPTDTIESVSEPAVSPGRRPPGTFRIGRLAGADVLVNRTWFVLAGLIAVVMAPRIEETEPGLGVIAYVAGLGLAAVLYLSVLLHEASHAYVARHYGFTVTSITLHFLGGMTSIDSESRNPRQEFWIAVVGPLTSIAVGGAAGGLLLLSPDGLLRLTLIVLAASNLLVGALNLVPGLPLDGGRVLKAAVWRVTGDRNRGTLVAGWGGRVAAVLVLGWPLLRWAGFATRPEALDIVLAGVIAAFLWGGASASVRSAQFRSQLPSLAARTLSRRALEVPSDLPLAEAVRRAEESDSPGIVTVTGAGTPVGLVDRSALLATPLERRNRMPTSTVARELVDALRLPIDLAGEELLRAMGRNPASEYVLVDTDGTIVGVLVTEDVDAAYREAKA
jgi:Zn-dependent protease